MNRRTRRIIRAYLSRFDILLVLLVPAIFAMGTVGFRIFLMSAGDEEFADLTWLDCMYSALCAFILEWDAPMGPKPWQLELFRWLAPLSIIAAVAGVLSKVLAREWPRLRARLSRQHTLVCGLGARGTWICREVMRTGGGEAVAVELDGSGDPAVELQEKGVVTLQGNARDITVLQAANLRRAQRVVIVTGDDETNLAIAKEVAEEVQHCQKQPEIVAAVEGYAPRAYFAAKLWQTNRIRIVGFRHYASLRLANEIAQKLAEKYGPIPARPPVLCVEASDALRIELLRALIMLVQISGDDRPIIHICGADSRDRAYFDDLFPSANLAARLHWHRKSAIKLLRKRAKGFDQIDAAIFALEPDTASLHAAESFKMACANDQPMVYACMLDTDDLLTLAENNSWDDESGTGITVKSLYKLEHGCEQNASLFDLYEKGAEAIAKKYDDLYPPADPKLLTFKNKTLFLQDSNRMAAMHADIKKELWKKHVSGVENDEQVIEHLCKCEHMRWIGFHVMEGWQKKKKKKDTQRKRHPDLIPFASLDAKGQAKDKDPVNWAIKGEC